MVKKFVVCSLFFVLFPGCQKRKFNASPDPSRINAYIDESERLKSAYKGYERFDSVFGLEKNFHHLPRSGITTKIPWADSNWPSARGGIMWRWQDPTYNYLKVRMEYFQNKITKEKILAMKPEQINKLSPIEKYEIYIGNFDFPITKNNIYFSDADAPPWAGICDGFSSAALHYKEPKPIEKKGPSGLTVAFASSDIKALLSIYQKFGEDAVATGNLTTFEPNFNDLSFEEARAVIRKRLVTVGAGCADSITDSPDCANLTAGLFHLLMTNFIGIKKVGMVTDVAAKDRTYYQPAFKFNSKILHEKKEQSNGRAVTKFQILTTLTTAVDLKEINANTFDFTLPQWETRLPHSNRTQDRNYKYNLTVDEATGEIVSSQWLSAEVVKEVFRTVPTTGFKGALKYLNELYVPAE